MTAPTPRVTIERLEAGMYAVLLDGVRPADRPVLLADFVGWRFHVGDVGHPLLHRTFGTARAWLETPDGRAWVAALRTAGEAS